MSGIVPYELPAIKEVVDAILSDLRVPPNPDRFEPPKYTVKTKGLFCISFSIGKDILYGGVIVRKQGKVHLRFFSDRERDLILSDKYVFIKLGVDISEFDIYNNCKTSVFVIAE